MRIAVWHNLPSGGGNRALAYHLKGLYNRGHYIEIWCPPCADNAFSNIKKYVHAIHIIPLSITSHSHKQYKIRDWKTALFWRNTKLMNALIKHCKQCAHEINKGNFDVLFANSCQLLFNSFIGRYVTIPKLIYLGEPNREIFEAYPKQLWQAPVTYNLFKFGKELWSANFKRVLIREEIANFKAYNKVLVNSFFSSESLMRAYGEAGEVCYLGIDTTLFNTQENTLLQNQVIGLGSITHTKGIEMAIEAVSKVKAVIRPALVWIGNVGNKQYINDLIMQANTLQVHLDIKENITDALLVQQLQLSQCMIYTSRLEPFGLAPLEANACGCPVVAIAEGGVRETIQDGINGLTTYRNAMNLAACIEKIITDNDLRKQLSLNAINTVQQKWSFERGIDNIENALQSIIK
jgi:glycosyltransferase involved in cell wall biosynthesis